MLKRIFIASLFTAFTFSTTVALAVPVKLKSPISPTTMQANTTKDVVKMLTSRHYRDMPFDDRLSTQFLTEYLENLDPSKMYFLASDIAKFEPMAKRFDDDFKAGNLDSGFAIYKIFQKRIVDRLQSIIVLLEVEKAQFDFASTEKLKINPKLPAKTKELKAKAQLGNQKPAFDFTVDEQYEIDREAASWPNDVAEADELWRKRLKLTVLNQKLNGKEPEKAVETLTKRYKNQLKRIKQQNNVDVYEALINSLTVLYDPHTSYFSPRTSENFNINMSLSLEGIGAVLKTEDEYTKVVRLVAGGPAHKAGELKAADKIVGVGQGDKGEIVDVVGWRLDEVVDLIRGQKGTIVKLELLKDGNAHELISIKRDRVKLEDQAAKKAIIEVDNNGTKEKVGIIDIPAFYHDFRAARSGNPNYKSTTRDVKRLVEELVSEKVAGIVLDLRNNGGGSLQEATQLTDLFIDQGPVVQIRQADGRVNRGNRAYSRALYRGPLVVMINRLSASASEIFAGAIQDYKRGLIVGTQSFGKGTVQGLNRMPEGELKLTESKFYRVSGDSTQHRGVIPDIEFPMVISHEDVGESTYDTALPWDQIHPANHVKYFNINPILAPIEEAHKKRAVKSPDFVNLLARIELSKVNRNKKFVSLNEKVRIKEKQELEGKSLVLENTLRLAKGKKAYKNYEEFKKAQEEESEKAEAEGSGSATQIDIENDALLTEASNILLDFRKLAYPQKSSQVAKHK